MFSTLLSIALVAVILGAAAYFLVAQSKEKPKIGGDTTNENANDTTSTSSPTNNN
jgi:hypothetical protein